MYIVFVLSFRPQVFKVQTCRASASYFVCTASARFRHFSPISRRPTHYKSLERAFHQRGLVARAAFAALLRVDFYFEGNHVLQPPARYNSDALDITRKTCLNKYFRRFGLNFTQQHRRRYATNKVAFSRHLLRLPRPLGVRAVENLRGRLERGAYDRRRQLFGHLHLFADCGHTMTLH